MMDKLISADKLAQAFKRKTWYSADEIQDEIADAQGVDAEPVRHGRWILHGEPPIYTIECSVCRQYYFHHWNQQEKAKYCGMCGARMDGDENGNEHIPKANL